MKPKLICITPIRNEAWCLDLFLKCTSIWADYIIIADQNSDDGSRNIAMKYPKVILIDNNCDEFNEPERQKILIKQARQIKGDKILFALDADEILTANFIDSNDWQKIINSLPGSVFCFKWANITPDKKHYFPSKIFYPWVFHDDGVTDHLNYVRWMHSMRIPYPQKADLDYYEVNDFKVFHLAWIDQKRVESKNRFYQCMVKIKDPNIHYISLYRTYNKKKERVYPIPTEWLENNIYSFGKYFHRLSQTDTLTWYDMEVKRQIIRFGITSFKKLDIWNKNWISSMKDHIEIFDPRSIYIKIVHQYLRLTQKYCEYLIIRAIDKMLKRYDK